MHIYLIESTDKIIINKTIDGLLKKINLDKSFVIRHNMQEISISSVIEELDTYNFLTNTKVIVCEDCFFMSSSRNKSVINHNIEHLKRYISNPSKDNYLVLICDKLSDKKEIKDIVSNNVEIINTSISITTIIKDSLEDFKMSNPAINLLINYCLNDNEKILTELEKLKTYKYQERYITEEDIEKIVIRDFDDNVFDLVNEIVKRNSKKALDIYNRIMINEKDSTLIIASLASNIRNMYSSKVLFKEGKSIDDIASLIGVKPRAISISIENGRTFSEKNLLFLLNKLADLDISIKTGINDNNILFELFLLNL